MLPNKREKPSSGGSATDLAGPRKRDGSLATVFLLNEEAKPETADAMQEAGFALVLGLH